MLARIVVLVCASLAAVMVATVAHAQPRRDFIPIGFEFCMIASADLDRAEIYAIESGFQPMRVTDTVTEYALLNEDSPPFMSIRRHVRDGGGFGIECGFAAFDVGEITDEDVGGWARSFGLERLGKSSDPWRYIRWEEEIDVSALVSSITPVPCPAPDAPVAELSPEIRERIRQVCGRTGLRFIFQSVDATEKPVP